MLSVLDRILQALARTIKHNGPADCAERLNKVTPLLDLEPREGGSQKLPQLYRPTVPPIASDLTNVSHFRSAGERLAPQPVGQLADDRNAKTI